MTAIVILGAAVWADGPSPTLRRRALHGAALFQAGDGTCIIACGGEGSYPPSEAKAIRDILVAEGVDSNAIILEDQSSTTYENLRNARVLLRARKMSDIVIVTDRFHGLRSMMVARALGLKTCLSAPPIPDTPRYVRLRRLLHEAIALPKYALSLPWWLWRDRS